MDDSLVQESHNSVVGNDPNHTLRSWSNSQLGQIEPVARVKVLVLQ